MTRCRSLCVSLGVSLLLAAAAPQAAAAQYELELMRISVGSSNGSVASASLDGREFIYDDVAGTVTQVSPVTSAVFKLGPVTELFSHRFRGALFDLAGGTISATSYACVEGNFGNNVGASLCGNTTFGDDFTNDTTLDYTLVPGTRIVGGDDVVIGPQQQLADYAVTLAGFDGATLRVQSAAWTANPGRAGVQLEFETSAITPRVAAPDIRNLDQAAAEAAVAGAGLAVGTVSRSNHPSVPAGSVISQNPSACAACIPAGSAVNFVISLGPITGHTASDLLMNLGDDVSALGLQRGPGRVLSRHLHRARIAIERNRYFAALVNLRLFSRQVERLSGRQIPSADAGKLVAGAADIADRLRKGLMAAPVSGLRQFTSQDAVRSYYIDIPADYSAVGEPKPVLFMFHGTGGTYQNFLPGGIYTAEGSDLRQKVGNDAIIVMPNALPGEDGVNQWNHSYDFAFFQDLLDELRGGLVFDERRIFATGHSSGGGFTHELGCRHGDVVRAIAPSAGALTSTSCTGSVAVMQIQSMNDSVVSPNIVESSRKFWVLYNGFDPDSFRAGTTNPCVDYSDGSSPYPMQWCFHEDTGRGGHQWWSKADAIWDFFATLPIAEPTTDHPPGGGNDRVNSESGTTLSFTLSYPGGIGAVWRLAAVLYPAGTQQPVFVSPIWFLNIDIDPGAAVPGTQQSYTVPVRLFDPTAATPLPGTYAVTIAAYVTGGGFPTPVPGVDHMVFKDVQIVDKVTPIVINEALTLEPVQ